MAVPMAVLDWLEGNGHGAAREGAVVAGGCISSGRRLSLDSGASFFLKTNPSAPQDMFAREAEGLALLAVPDGPRVPHVYLWGDDFILMEDLAPRSPAAGYWEEFGRQLAWLHRHHAEEFGHSSDNFIGSTLQPNTPTADGYAFFSECRLGYQAQLAFERGLLTAPELDRVKHISRRLREWIPDQPAAILHGDLWSGNMVTDSKGAPAIIDPAAHYGWPEADLAMTALFGRPPERFYGAYSEIRPLAPGFWGRTDLYNLYHLLNHLNLFGLSYAGQVRGVLRRYG